MFSVAILTYNEERTLPACLDSAAGLDDVLVFDSFSTDHTVEIARGKGARVMQHAFVGYASQRNTCLEQGQFKHEWVFMLDADERFTPGLIKEILNVLAAATPDQTLFRLRRKDFFLGTWIKRAGLYPTWFGRLMRNGHVRVSREINEHYETAGAVGYLREHLMHEPFAKGLAPWIARHNQYSTLEAQNRISELSHPLNWDGMLSRDPTRRRALLKQIAYRVPARPLWILLYLLLIRGAVLEGRAGVAYAALRAWYELCIDLKCQEKIDAASAK